MSNTFTIGTASFTNGSKTVSSVSLLKGSLTRFSPGTRVVVGANPVVNEVGANRYLSADSFELDIAWELPTGTYSFFANMTSEGLWSAVQQIRGNAEMLQAYNDSFNELLTSTEPMVSINGNIVVPFGYLVAQGQSDVDAFISNNQTAIDQARAMKKLKDNAVFYLDFKKDEGHQHNDLAVTRGKATDLITYTCSTTATGQTLDGRIVEVAPNTSRLVGRDSESLGILNEPSGENLLLWSEDFTQGGWFTDNASIQNAPGIASPIIGGSVFKMVEAATNGEHNLQQNVSSGYSTGNGSCYYFVKAAERTEVNLFFAGTDVGSSQSVTVDLLQTQDTENSEYVGGGWHKVYATSEIASTGGFIRGRLRPSLNGSVVYQGDGSSGIYVAASQLEQGYPTSYIPTTTSSAVRGAAKHSATAQINKEQFYIYAEFEVQVFEAKFFSAVVVVQDGSGTSNLGFVLSSNSTIVGFRGANISTINTGLTEGRHKALGVVDGGVTKFFFDGVLIGTGTADQQNLDPSGNIWFSRLADSAVPDRQQIHKEFALVNAAINDAEALALTTLEDA